MVVVMMIRVNAQGSDGDAAEGQVANPLLKLGSEGALACHKH